MWTSSIFWRLPHDLRRRVFAKQYPERYAHYQFLRTNTNSEGYSYQQFEQHRAIFVHIPKAAGISVAKSLFGCKAAGHDSVKDYLIAFSRAEYRNYFKFTIVRNPWDRLLSAYTFLSRGGMCENDKQWSTQHLARYKTFDQFVQEGLGRPEVRDWVHFRPQASFLRPYPRARPAVDFIGRFEQLNKNYERIRERMPTALSDKLGHLNASRSREDFRRMYSDRTRELVAEHYADDIDLLGYTFDGPA